MRHTIYLTENAKFNYGSDPVQIGGFGYTSTGKTYAAMSVFAQFPSGIFFDPQSRAKNVLEEQLTKVEQGKEKLEKWKFLKVQYRAKKNTFLMNAQDLHPRLVTTLAKTSSKRDYLVRRAFSDFFQKQKAQRVFSTLIGCFHRYRLDDVFSDISLILDANDSALPLKTFNSRESKTIIDISEISPQSYVPGIIIESIVGNRSDHVFANDPFIFGIDEVQEYAKYNLTGWAFAQCATRTRIFGISTAVFGTNYSPIVNVLRQNLKILLLFKNSFNIQAFNKEFRLKAEEKKVDALPFGQDVKKKGYCLYFNKNEDLVHGVQIRPNTYYLLRDFEFKAKNRFYEPISANRMFISRKSKLH